MRRCLGIFIGMAMAASAASVMAPSGASAQDAPPRPSGPKPAPPEHIATPPRVFTPPAALAKEPVPVAPVVIADPENTLVLDLSTGGRVLIALRPDKAPKHVERVKLLARQHFYDGTIFHRVIEGFMAQGGDPTGTGLNGSKLPNLAPEFNDLPHLRGTVSMARANDLNSANSQFFIMFAPRLSLDGSYTNFGRVISGMQYVDAIERGEPPATPSKIVLASIAADKVPPPPPAPAVVKPVAAAIAAPAAPVTVKTVTKTKVVAKKR